MASTVALHTSEVEVGLGKRLGIVLLHPLLLLLPTRPLHLELLALDPTGVVRLGDGWRVDGGHVHRQVLRRATEGAGDCGGGAHVGLDGAGVHHGASHPRAVHRGGRGREVEVAEDEREGGDVLRHGLGGGEGGGDGRVGGVGGGGVGGGGGGGACSGAVLGLYNYR